MEQKIAVTVIVVNYNSGHFLRECIQSLLRQSLRPKQILIVDNCSSDNSLDEIEETQQVKILRESQNLGFAEANNKAMILSETEFVALLNPDAVASADWLEQLVAGISIHPNAASFGSKQFLLNKPNTIDGVGDFYHVSGYLGRMGHNRPAHSIKMKSDIFSACGCAVLFRKDIFIAAGGFDRDFFCYIEDIDLGFRLRLLGYSAILVEDAVVYHAGSATTGGHRSDFSVYYGHRNLVWTFIKNMPGILFWGLLPLHIVLNLGSILYLLLQGKGRAIIQAKIDAILGIPKMWRKRQQIQSKRRVSTKDIWKCLDKSFALKRK